MARRVSVPAADHLFRKTEDGAADGVGKPQQRAVRAVPDEPPAPAAPVKKAPSGRIKHDEKMTVYVTSAELLELEHARLRLRSDHGLAVDRGRLVREALHLVLADLEAHGEESALLQRLREE